MNASDFTAQRERLVEKPEGFTLREIKFGLSSGATRMGKDVASEG
jgi:hypothetical protein